MSRDLSLSYRASAEFPIFGKSPTNGETAFSGTAILIGMLEEALGKNPAARKNFLSITLSEYLSSLSPNERHYLHQQLGPSLDEMIAVSKEVSLLRFGEGVLDIARGLEERNVLPPALKLYALVGAIHELPLQGIAKCAQERIDAIQGSGAIAPHVGFVLKRVPEEVLSPSGLLAMAAAGPVFRFTTAVAGGVLGNGVGAWLASHSLGFLAESGAFAFIGKGARELLSRRGGSRTARTLQENWSLSALKHEWIAVMPMLLGLKLTLGATGIGIQRFAAAGYGKTAFEAGTMLGTQQAGLLSGIMVGNGISEYAGYLPERAMGMRLATGLTEYLHFSIAGGILGAGHREVRGSGFGVRDSSSGEGLVRPTLAKGGWGDLIPQFAMDGPSTEFSEPGVRRQNPSSSRDLKKLLNIFSNALDEKPQPEIQSPLSLPPRTSDIWPKIFDALPDPLSVTDSEGMVLYSNPAARNSLGIGDLSQISEVHAVNERALLVEEAIPTALREGVWKGETKIHDLEGREVAIFEEISAHQTEDGQTHLAILMRDIKYQRREENLQIALRNAEENASTLQQRTLDMVHDARNVLGRLSNFLHLAGFPLEALVKWAERAERETVTVQELEQMLISIRSMTDVPNSTTGEKPSLFKLLVEILSGTQGDIRTGQEQVPELEKLFSELGEFMGKPNSGSHCEIHELLRRPSIRSILGRGVLFSTDLVPDPWQVSIPEVQMLRVLSNLLNNARDAMEDRPIKTVVVVTSRHVLDSEFLVRKNVPPHVLPGPYMRISIMDSGTGIPAELIDKIFERGFSTKERGRKSTHLGRGLAIVEESVHDAGGFITVESKVNEGTTFHVYLPKAEPVTDPAPPPSQSTRGESQAKAAVEPPVEKSE